MIMKAAFLFRLSFECLCRWGLHRKRFFQFCKVNLFVLKAEIEGFIIFSFHTEEKEL